jgi:hypothetical protein
LGGDGLAGRRLVYGRFVRLVLRVPHRAPAQFDRQGRCRGAQAELDGEWRTADSRPGA